MGWLWPILATLTLQQRLNLEEGHTSMSSRAIGMWLVAGVLGTALGVQAASVTLKWDPPSDSAEVAGYKLHYGRGDQPGPERYTDIVDVCKMTRYTLGGLAEDIEYVLAVQAYAADGRTSDFSNEVRYRVPVSGPVRVVAVDSEETTAENGTGGNVLDGDPATIWHTERSAQAPPHPHHIILDLGSVRTVYGIRYLPRQDGNLNGTIMSYELYVSADLETWGTPWMSGSWTATADEKILLQSSGQSGRYLKLVATSEASEGPWTSAAEIQIIFGLP
jgi:F5/8 type C domain/Fibronectin type III domain